MFDMLTIPVHIDRLNLGCQFNALIKTQLTRDFKKLIAAI